MLVRTGARNPRGIADLTAALRTLGFEVTGTGQASVSARATRRTFAAAFGDAAPPPDAASALASRALAVPPPLAEYVESISVAPAHIVISRRGSK